LEKRIAALKAKMAPVQKVRSGESLSEEDDYEDDYDNDDEDESEEDTRKKTPGEKRSSTNGHKPSDSAKRVKRFVAGGTSFFFFCSYPPAMLTTTSNAERELMIVTRMALATMMMTTTWKGAIGEVHSGTFTLACFLALSLTILVDACGIAERPDMIQESINIEWMTMIKTWNPRLDRCPKKKSERAFLPPKTPLALPRTGEY
jgi:hypothetical protein